PYNTQGATPEHPAFPRGVLVATDLEKPLFWEHDYSFYIGKVLRIWEAEDGVRFAAQVAADTPAAKGVSVGGAYVTDGKDVKALYIYEISLTDSPAYRQTKYTIMATEK
ncbi:MAG: HK97 family phage prohead protease, partial [Bacteroidia bacterium]|nr:HK97 family phage prohead protease [Bacteroidia bacterium]